MLRGSLFLSESVALGAIAEVSHLSSEDWVKLSQEIIRTNIELESLREEVAQFVGQIDVRQHLITTVQDRQGIGAIGRYIQLLKQLKTIIKTNKLDEDNRFSSYYVDNFFIQTRSKYPDVNDYIATLAAGQATGELKQNFFKLMLENAVEPLLLFLSMSQRFASTEYARRHVSLVELMQTFVSYQRKVFFQHAHNTFSKRSKNSELTVNFNNDSFKDVSLDIDLEVVAFGIQRVVSNMYRLADTVTEVFIEYDANNHSLHIVDNGIGFNGGNLATIGRELKPPTGERNLSGGVGFAFLVHSCKDMGIEVKFSNGYSALDGTEYPGAHVALDLSNVVVGK